MVNQKGEYLTEYCRDPKGWTDWNKDTWTPKLGINVVLEGAVEIGSVSRGRSAAGCTVTCEGQTYYMSIGNVVETLRLLAEGRRLISTPDGKVMGLWTFAKQGTTISLTPYVA